VEVVFVVEGDEVKIRITEKENFRPGMSVTADVETRSRSNVLSVPIASVTTRLPKESTNNPAATTNQLAKADTSRTGDSSASSSTDARESGRTNVARADKKGEGPKPVEVVFVVEGDEVKMVPVKRGISDDAYVEITEGLTGGQEVVSGGYKAISRELEDGKKIKKGRPERKDKEKEKK